VMQRSLSVTAAVLLAAVAVITAPAQAQPQPNDVRIPTATITVSAAASLTDTFPLISAAFQRRYPQVRVRMNFSGSNALVEQIRSGAPVDVLATASESTMQLAYRVGLTKPSMLFARNALMIATPPGNPGRIRGLADLQNNRVLVAVCAPAVPCGVATDQLLKKNRIPVRPVTRELDVRAVLGKVIADQVDAGIVYRTDVRAARNRVMGIAIPDHQNVFVNYAIAVTADPSNERAAKAFIDFVRYSRTAQEILRSSGFGTPW
jgi:molybdate transport system substrate-binding protein